MSNFSEVLKSAASSIPDKADIAKKASSAAEGAAANVVSDIAHSQAEKEVKECAQSIEKLLNTVKELKGGTTDPDRQALLTQMEKILNDNLDRLKKDKAVSLDIKESLKAVERISQSMSNPNCTLSEITKTVESACQNYDAALKSDSNKKTGLGALKSVVGAIGKVACPFIVKGLIGLAVFIGVVFPPAAPLSALVVAAAPKLTAAVYKKSNDLMKEGAQDMAKQAVASRSGTSTSKKMQTLDATSKNLKTPVSNKGKSNQKPIEMNTRPR